MIALRRWLLYVHTFLKITSANGSCADRLYHFQSEELQPRISVPSRFSGDDSNFARCNWRITQLARDSRMDKARRLFDGMLDGDVVIWTTVISRYVKCGMLDKARELFDRPDAMRNVVTWTAMLGGYVKLRRLSEAWKLFEGMPEKNVVSWNTVIAGYARSGRIDEALDLFKMMPERNVMPWNTMITSLSHCRRIERMPERDVISWTAMVAGLSRNGMIDEAKGFFDAMPRKNTMSWNAMITGYAQNMRVSEALDLFKRMPERDLPLWNTKITWLVQNGDLKSAQDLFEDMPHKNVVSWTTLINGYVPDGQNEQALMIFSKMLADDAVKPNGETCIAVHRRWIRRYPRNCRANHDQVFDFPLLVKILLSCIGYGPKYVTALITSTMREQEEKDEEVIIKPNFQIWDIHLSEGRKLVEPRKESSRKELWQNYYKNKMIRKATKIELFKAVLEHVYFKKDEYYMLGDGHAFVTILTLCLLQSHFQQYHNSQR